jgi:hypothetical protein
MARPTEYDSTFPYFDTALEYLKTCGREQTKLPKIEEYCELIGIDIDTSERWCKLYPDSEFCGAIKKVRTAQKGELIDDGLFGGKEVNPGMAIFLLKVNHNMIEKNQTDFTSNGETLHIWGPKKEE